MPIPIPPRPRSVSRLPIAVVLGAGALAYSSSFPSQAADAPAVSAADVVVIATGIPGAGAICQVGTFHRGGPFPGKPAVVPGAILGPERLLVASSSNFGALLARTDEAPGPILSIDPRRGAVTVPADLANARPGGDPQ